MAEPLSSHRCELNFRTLMESLPGAITVADSLGRQVFVNAEFCRLVGWSEEELLGRCAPFVYWPAEDAAQTLDSFRQFHSADCPNSCDCIRRYCCKNGERFLVRMRRVPLFDADGLTIGSMALVEDLRSLEAVGSNLHDREQFFESIVRKVPGFIYVFDLGEGVNVYTNRVLAEALGYTPESIQSMGREFLARLLHPDDLALLPQHLARWETTQDHQVLETEYRIRSAKGEYRWYLSRDAVFRRDAAGKVLQLIGSAQDITPRKNAQAAQVEAERHVRQSEELFRTLVERSLDGIALLESHGQVRYLSPAGTEILGYTQEELASVDVRTLVVPDDYQAFAKAAGESLARPGGFHASHVRIRNRRGSIRHLEIVVANHLLDPFIGAYVANFSDVTDRIELEEQLRQAQKMEAVGQLAGGIAHDFNNILTAIIGNVSVILDATAANDQRRSTLTAIEHAAQRAAELTSRLLGYSRRTTLRLRPTDLNRVVDELLKLLRPTIDPRIVFEPRLDPDLWSAQADADQMSQVLTNLCLNARDAMPRGGRLIVRSSNCVIDEEYVRSRVIAAPGQYVMLRVEDTGTGMSADVRGRIFEPFFTTKATGAGTGLGLAMVYGILKSHGGWVTCESEPGRGTRMDLFLPRSLERAEDPSLTIDQPRSLSHGQPLGGETVLLVDDEASIRALGRHILERHGYRVLLAEDGLEAVQIFQDMADQIGLVILDLTMPVMSGQDAFRQLRAIASKTKVLFSSGFSAHQLGELDSNASFINKPYRPEELLEAVRRLIQLDQLSG